MHPPTLSTAIVTLRNTAAHTMRPARLSPIVTSCNAQLSIGEPGISPARIRHSPPGNRPTNPPIVGQRTVLFKMPDPISDANASARNDQDALYDKQYQRDGLDRLKCLIR
jgi:hypothetical protein